MQRNKLIIYLVVIGVIFFTLRVFNRYSGNSVPAKIEIMDKYPIGTDADGNSPVYYDTDKSQFYIIKWEDRGNGPRPVRHYIPRQ